MYWIRIFSVRYPISVGNTWEAQNIIESFRTCVQFALLNLLATIRHVFVSTNYDNRGIGVRAEMACLENVTEIGRTGSKDESMGRHVSSARRGQQNVREGLRVEQRSDGAMQMRPVTVPLQLIILRGGDGHFFYILNKKAIFWINTRVWKSDDSCCDLGVAPCCHLNRNFS